MRVANDGEKIAPQGKVVEALKAELRKIKASEDVEIRKLLTPEQDKSFDAYIETRNNMVGSSRDVRNQ